VAIAPDVHELLKNKHSHMKIFTLVAALMGSLLMTHLVMAQETWPKSTTTTEGTVVKLYQWQPESFADNTLKAHAAVSILESGKSEPVFGVAWIKATTTTEGQQVKVQSIYITNLKIPGLTDDDKLDHIANSLEDNVSSWNISFPQSDLQTSLDLNKQQNNLAGQINNTPPKVLYSSTPSILVLIDGAPKLKHNSEWDVDAVVNTPFVIVKNHDDQYYLYGGKHWYTAPAATGPYKMITSVPSNLEKIENAVKDAGKNNSNDGKETDPNTIYNIVVSTEPAELIQSKGEANFAPVEGTGLLYVANSENDIFMDINSQTYYVLLSGRWYNSKTLSGDWQYVPSDKLPADFAKIPKGSPKDNVLASVAGTPQASDAVANAQVPQTAKVERSKVHANVNYDGDPDFEPIDGTDMYYAVNSPVSVIRWRGRYYCVDDGIWFESYNAVGPWAVCVSRPYVVALIPPRYPVYYMKYVDIYDVGPDYVYMGYTPGYLNAYVYGPTVVYGTGYYYRPWYHTYYYPRPYTWGFAVRYNPWYGWGFGVGFGYDWFNMSIGFGHPWGYGCGGWWGPRVYCPAYYGPSYYYRGGYYGRNSYSVYRQTTNVTVVNNYYNNTNIYNNRTGIVTNNYPRFGGPSGGGRMATGYASNAFNNRDRSFDRTGVNNRFDPAGNNNGRRPFNSDGSLNRSFNQPNNGGRMSTNPAGGNNRIINQPADRGNGDWRNNAPVQNQRYTPPQRQPVQQFDGNRFENRPSAPQQRSFQPSDRGGFGGGRMMQSQPQSRPSGPGFAPRGGGGGGSFSRPSGGGGGGRSFGGSSGGGGSRGGGRRGW
jgi:hypothetical protein